ncbi:MAG: T9SS type A sorting domain-containing protein [Gemmatimonadetes bacterium]|nr:T9SS type A sorting domain-containing protein [Gemmatimonadota bacterium]
MRSNRIVRVAAAALLLVAGTMIAAASADARPAPGRPAARRGFNLLASAELPMDVNRIFCGINNLGEVCVALAGSPVAGGGIWPKGTPDQYIFNSGLQVAGIIPANAGFAWANDTVGAYFMDPRGTQAQGSGLTPVYNSLDPADVANWPNGAMVRDAALYSPVLLGRKVVSQQDIWVRSWDGNASLLSGRTHPMGVAVDIRGMGWNYPSGNEDILYFIYTFYNVTASDPTKYSSLDPAIQAEIAAVGQQFQDEVKSKLNVTIPAAGYRFDSLYAAFFEDPDVGDAGSNYSTAILPFNLGIAYKADFLEPNWQFPPDIFGNPFAAAPGFTGVKYLKSPIDPATGQEVGLTMFSNTVNLATGFPDPVGVVQLWRYLSGNVSPARGDNPCSVQNPKVRKLCFLYQTATDTRFYQASGPFSLDPGKSATIVVAYVHGAPVAKWLAGRIGDPTLNPPGTPPSGDTIFARPASVRFIDSIAGWVSAADGNGNSIIEENEITVVQRSLLDKAKVAQAVFGKQFLLTAAPEAPPFYLVPGDNQVTVVWSKSPTETTGDPYFAVASDPSDPALYDPNFRKFDVEGYRVYRGRTTGALELVAQYDYAGTAFTDVTGNFDYGNRCAPELGLDTLPGCPVDFSAGETNDLDIVSPFVQVQNGGRVLLADTTVATLKSDTAVTGGASGYPPLENTGVPFAFVDKGVRNSFTYYYAVTAFDINSVKATGLGFTSLESSRVTKSVTPRAAAPNQVVASLSVTLQGDSGVILDPTTPWSIDATTGKFSGSPPPTDMLQGTFAPLVPALLPALNLSAKIDSVVPRYYTDFDCGDAINAFGACFEVFGKFTKDGTATAFKKLANIPVWSAFGEPTSFTVSLGAVPVAADAAAAARYGIPSGFSSFNATVTAGTYQSIGLSSFEGQAARRQGTGGIPSLGGNASNPYSPGGSRWFDGSSESTDHPANGIRVGHLAGTDTVWAPIHHVKPPVSGSALANSGTVQFFGYCVANLAREADVQFTWGSGGTISSVRDVTHHVAVPFSEAVRSSYGFMGDFDGDGVISWLDFFYPEGIASCGYDNVGIPDPIPSPLPKLSQNPVVMAVSTSTSGAPAATGTGFGLYVNGERYIVQLTGGAAPASGTKWTLRTYAGYVRASNASTATPSGYTYLARPRPALIPGAQVVFKVAAPTALAEETDSTIALVHTVPDPYYVTTSLEASTNTKILKFVNLPPKAIIRIYSVSGVLVKVIEHNDVSFGGEQTWDLRSRTNQFVASGVYFYHVESASGKTKIGRLTVVNFAQ